MRNQRVMVDMSATLIHHGHVRLLKKASEYGDVVVGLTTDAEIVKKKGYKPELSYEHREEILKALGCVFEVVPTPWLIDQSVLDRFNIDVLVHGDDNSNLTPKDQTKVLPRTSGISSTALRSRAAKSLTQINNQKLMLTPGPAAVLHENMINLKPLFGRGDSEYTVMADAVVEWVRQLSGQEEVVFAQGSATFGLELALHSFVSGRVLLIRNKVNSVGAQLFVDATGSIGLEDHHELADVLAFSSCKGLFGLTGACFIGHKQGLIAKDSRHFYFNINTHKNKMVTGPYHAIASLYGVIKKHSLFRQRVINSKNHILNKYKDIVRDSHQPLLCTYIEGEVVACDDHVVLYSPRSELSGSVICHFGEIHHDVINIDKRIEVKTLM